MTNTIPALTALTATTDFSAPVESLTLRQQVEAYTTILFAEDAAKTRREALREVLLKAAEAHGEPTAKGGNKLSVDGHTVNRERRVASTPDEKKLMGLLEKKSLTVEQAFDKVTVLQPNPSKISALVEAGHLSQADADALYKQTFALVVRSSRDFEALLENAIPAELSAPKKSR